MIYTDKTIPYFICFTLLLCF